MIALLHLAVFPRWFIISNIFQHLFQIDITVCRSLQCFEMVEMSLMVFRWRLEINVLAVDVLSKFENLNEARQQRIGLSNGCYVNAVW